MVETDPRLVRLVARHFNDMRGYATALSGVVMVAFAAAYLASGSQVVAGLAIVAAIAAVWIPMRQADRYYRNRFGCVVQGTGRHRVLIAFAVSAGCLSAAPLGLRALWVILSLYPGWLLIDGWPYRKHMILETGVALGAALLTRGQPVTAPVLAPWFLLFGLAAIVSGLADHALLLRVMRATTADASREVPDADTV